MTIKANGDVVPCGLLVDYVCGNVKKENVRDIFNNRNLKKIKRIPISRIKDCAECELAFVCGGGCRVNSLAKYGDLFHKDPGACESMKLLFDKVNKLLKKYGFRIKFTNIYKNSVKKVYVNNSPYYF